jgi:hypothetical protein
MSAATNARNQRDRLKRMIAAVSQKPTAGDIIELDALLQRVAPMRSFATPQSRFVGMNALTLTRDTLPTLTRMSLVFHKVNGIGALAAMSAKGSRSATEGSQGKRMIFVRRNGAFVVDNVVLPLRSGRVLMDGELCVRRRELSAAEKAHLHAPIPCVVGYEYMEPDDDLPENDAKYELCFMAHDLLVDDSATVSGSRARTGDAVAVLQPIERLTRLKALLQASPTPDARTDEALTAAVTELAGAEPAVTLIFKEPYLAVNIRLALRTLPACLHGVPRDGLVFMPGTGEYRIGETNPALLKYKAWRDNTADLVITVDGEGRHKMHVLRLDNKARCISERLWMGDTNDEREVTRASLDLEVERLAAGGAATAPLIYECEPSVESMADFLALPELHKEKEELLLAAAEMLRWRPIGVLRHEKIYPNSEINFFAIVDALVNCVTTDDIVRQIGGQ